MSQETSTTTPLTVVLVHGAFADASSWTGVIQRLQTRGVQVTAPANPLRGISIDSAYIASVIDQISGPVLAVGHSYGGAVISNAASMTKNVVGLVFVAAFAPDEGERLGAVTGGSKDSVLNSALVPRRYRGWCAMASSMRSARSRPSPRWASTPTRSTPHGLSTPPDEECRRGNASRRPGCWSRARLR